ncbi:AAA family ATPase [Pseudonocardia sp. ICBG601]|uniref:AAA family ATPase n=1 Tax=Pseudonocardia sp. ICBG601 TaxID=2846759 RepID=UPI001CF6D94C|nr:AAA family ATPase [Pseudonocardia sp. ICBG601]
MARFAESGRELGADQAAAVRGVLTSGARLEVLQAAAGTGKSFVVGALADAWTEHGGRVFGLAPSENAAQVLAEDGVTAANLARWLATQQRLDGPGQPADADAGWALRDGDLLVVDEAGMASTTQLAQVQQRAAAAGAKLLLVGDPAQLRAVGPGGALADMAARGVRYDLAEVRRFTAGWEGPASLRLRDGDPAVLDAYDRHGRLVDGGTPEQTEAAAARAWLADTLDGHDALLLLGSNEAADRAAAELRAELVSLGRVAEHGVDLAAHQQTAGVGDLVQGRRNGWELRGVDGNTRAPLNRSTYRVVATTDDGGLRVADAAGVEITLPPAYVAADLSLAYASTVHAAQGRTVDRAHAVLGPGSDPHAAYVALTRGRDGNWAWTVTRPVSDDTPTGQTLGHQTRTARAVLADLLDAGREPQADDLSATALAAQADADAVSVQRHLDRLTAEIAATTAGRTARDLDRLATTGALTDGQRAALAADPAFDGLERLLRTAELAGHDPAEVLDQAVRAGRNLDDVRSPASVLHHRISTALTGQLTPDLTSYADLIPAAVPADRRERLEQLAAAADDRRRDLGAQIADQAPQWAVEALGAVPDDPIDRAEWEHAAGWAGAHREHTGHEAADDALGAAPPAGLAEQHAGWRTAHRALGLPDEGADEAVMSDGQLRCWVRAYEREQNWAPPWVGDELADARRQEQRHRADATVWAARADAATDPDEAGQHRAEAEQADLRARGYGQRAAELDQVDEARGRWYLHTAETRDRWARAQAALGARGVDVDDPGERVTGEEWLAAHDAAVVEEERWRDVTEDDVRDDVPDRDLVRGAGPTAQSGVEDVRETSPFDSGEHRDRTPGAGRSDDDLATAVARAQVALAEIAARDTEDARAEQDPDHPRRREQLAQWAATDEAARCAAVDDEVDQRNG